MTGSSIGDRLRIVREARGMERASLAAMLGLSGSEEIAAIETGERRLTAPELIAAAEAFQVGTSHLTNPFLLDGEARFAWIGAAPTPAYETRAGEWAGAFRALSREPAGTLLVLAVDLPPGVEAGGLLAPGVGAVLVRGSDPATRRIALAARVIGGLAALQGIDPLPGVLDPSGLRIPPGSFPEHPPAYGLPLLTAIRTAIEEGRVSVRRAAALLDLTVDGLGDLLAAHGLPRPYDL